MISILGRPSRCSPASKSLNRVVETKPIRASIVTTNFARMTKQRSQPSDMCKRNGPNATATGVLSYSGQLKARTKTNGLTSNICLKANLSGIPPNTRIVKGQIA